MGAVISILAGNAVSGEHLAVLIVGIPPRIVFANSYADPFGVLREV